MTAASSRAVSALVVLLVCGAGALACYRVSQPAPRSGPLDVSALQAVHLDDRDPRAALDDIERALLPGDQALVSRAGSSATSVPDVPPVGSPATSEPDAPSAGSRATTEPPWTSLPAQPTAGPETRPVAPAAPASALVSTQGRVTYVRDDAELAGKLLQLGESTDVVSFRGADGLWIAVGAPRVSDPPGPSSHVAPVILLGAGVIAALAVLLIGGLARPAGRAAGPQTAVPPPPGGSPPPARPTPAPRRELDPATTAGEASASSLLARRNTVLRGLADLLTRLPDESAWQASRLLETAGARPIVPEPGTPFDPALHHVLDVEPTSDERQADTVAHILRPGWHDQEQDQVLVPAHVVLYAAPDRAGRELDDDRQ